MNKKTKLDAVYTVLCQHLADSQQQRMAIEIFLQRFIDGPNFALHPYIRALQENNIGVERNRFFRDLTRTFLDATLPLNPVPNDWIETQAKPNGINSELNSEANGDEFELFMANDDIDDHNDAYNHPDAQNLTTAVEPTSTVSLSPNHSPPAMIIVFSEIINAMTASIDQSTLNKIERYLNHKGRETNWSKDRTDYPAETDLHDLQDLLSDFYTAFCQYCGPVETDQILQNALKVAEQSPKAENFDPHTLL